MITAMLVLFITPYGCWTLPPVDARDIAETLGVRVLAMAEMQNRRAGVGPWWLQTKGEQDNGN